MTTRAVFPGSFDPIHFGHIDIARRGERLFDELIIAVYDKPRKSLLFTPEERIDLVKRSFSAQEHVRIVGYSSLTVDFAREVGAQVILRGLRVFSDFEHEFRMALANNRLVAEIETVALITSEKHTFLNATTVREIASLGGDVSSMVPEHVAAALKAKFAALGGHHNVQPNGLRD